jgi:hypothetical protein
MTSSPRVSMTSLPLNDVINPWKPKVTRAKNSNFSRKLINSLWRQSSDVITSLWRHNNDVIISLQWRHQTLRNPILQGPKPKVVRFQCRHYLTVTSYWWCHYLTVTSSLWYYLIMTSFHPCWWRHYPGMTSLPQLKSCLWCQNLNKSSVYDELLSVMIRSLPKYDVMFMTFNSCLWRNFLCIDDVITQLWRQ